MERPHLDFLAGKAGIWLSCPTETPVWKTQDHLSASTLGEQLAHIEGGGATLRSQISSSKPPTRRNEHTEGHVKVTP